MANVTVACESGRSRNTVLRSRAALGREADNGRKKPPTCGQKNTYYMVGTELVRETEDKILPPHRTHTIRPAPATEKSELAKSSMQKPRSEPTQAQGARAFSPCGWYCVVLPACQYIRQYRPSYVFSHLPSVHNYIIGRTPSPTFFSSQNPDSPIACPPPDFP